MLKRTRSQSNSKIPFRARKIPKLPITPTSNLTKPPHSQTIPKPLTSKDEINLALQHLRLADPLLSQCIDSFTPPEFPSHRPPFLSLTKSIISQQLSNHAAKSIHTRFVSLCGGDNLVLPQTVINLTVQKLREVGISGPKATYLHDLASKYREGLLCDDLILEMDDETLFRKLTMVKGIGPWSVHMFMMFTLHRPDVLPVGDLVVRRGVERLYGLKNLPKPSQMEGLCEKWKPYRTVGSWYMYRLMEAKGVFPTLSKVEVGNSV